ncbi:hypothetical protein [Streptomyces sp. NPDC058108]|uniref:hypothetical protein n=1 Tax=Streptomyces sp. NPDC058108 TaxID=3346344 RepID=UPI0036ECB5BA
MAVAIVAAALLASCAPSPADTAATDARKACVYFGAGEGGTSSEGQADPNDTDWTNLATGTDRATDIAARAARADRRWQRLADAFSTLYRYVEDKATERDTNGYSTAWTPEEQQQVRSLIDSLESDCRVARVD